jgi:FKBP-type peptidyl-prolyl cis-trans isomerase SlyD
MEINQQCVVALTWTLKDSLGEELDVLDEPVEFLVGGDDLFEVIETALQGLSFEGSALPAGCTPEAPKDALYTVTDIYPEHVVLDGNHPLAGIALRLTLHVHRVREATEEEVGSGSAGTGFFRVTPIDRMAPGSTLLH